MFIEIAQKICRECVAAGFYIAGAKNADETLTEDSKFVVLNSQEGPVFYVVVIVNIKQIPQYTYEDAISVYIEKLNQTLPAYECQHIICVSILIDYKMQESVKEFVLNKEYIPGERINHIWWYACKDTGEIYVAKSQPNKILNLEKITQAALLSKEDFQNQPLYEIEKSVIKETRPKRKSKDITLTAGLITVNILIFVCMYFLGIEKQLIQDFGTEYTAVITHKEYYRLFTSMFLHGSSVHLLSNALSLYIFGSRTEYFLGKINFLIIYFGSGILGGISSVLFTRQLSIGASGAVFGLTGAVFALVYKYGKRSVGLPFVTILAIILFNLVYGFGVPQIDNFSHIGGLFGGVLASFCLFKIQDKKQ